MHKVTDHGTVDTDSSIVDFDLQPFIGRSVKVRLMMQVVLEALLEIISLCS